MSDMIKPGRYRHYKGGLYDVLYNGTFEIDERPVVVYRAVKDDSIWVLYACYFFDLMEPDNVPRFEAVLRLDWDGHTGSSHRIARSILKPDVSYHVSDFQYRNRWVASLVNGHTSKRIGVVYDTRDAAIAFCEVYETSSMAADSFDSTTTEKE